MERLNLGRAVIHPLSEVESTQVDIPFLFNDLTIEDLRRNREWLDADIIDVENGKLGFSFRAYLVKLGGLNILVDACNGNHKNRPTARWQHGFDRPDFLDALNAAGVRPEDVNCVVCTHLHCDHVGWLTRLENGQWKPTFPNAIHCFSGREFEFFRKRYDEMPSTAVNHGSFEDSVLPVVETGRYCLVKSDEVLIETLEGRVRLMPSPGHSIDHLSVVIESEGQEAVVCGDAMHHPIQLDMPNIAMRADYDVDQARRSRIELLEYCASTGAWLLAGHFCKYPCIQVERRGDVYRIKNRD